MTTKAAFIALIAAGFLAPALVTPALRAMLSQPPELLPPPPGEAAAG